MTAKDFLDNAYTIKNKLEIKKQILEDTNRMLSEMSELEDKYGTCNSLGAEYNEITADLMEPLDSLETDIKNLYKQYVRLMEVISLVDGENVKIYLLMTYVQHKSAKNVADTLGMRLEEITLLQYLAEQEVNKILSLED